MITVMSDRRLEPMDDPPNGKCHCGQPAQYFYWGMNTIVCSAACADVIDKDVDDYFKRNPPHEADHDRT